MHWRRKKSLAACFAYVCVLFRVCSHHSDALSTLHSHGGGSISFPPIIPTLSWKGLYTQTLFTRLCPWLMEFPRVILTIPSSLFMHWFRTQTGWFLGRQGDSWGENQQEDGQGQVLRGTYILVGVFSLAQSGFKPGLARLWRHFIPPYIRWTELIRTHQAPAPKFIRYLGTT